MAYARKTLSFVLLGSLLPVALLGVSAAAYAQVQVPNTFSPGTTISSSQVNENFSALARSMPGMKAAIGGSVTLSTQWQNLTSLTVTPPADGLLVFFGAASVTITQGSTAGGSSWSTSSLGICVTQASRAGSPGNCAPIMLDTPPLPAGAPVQPYSPRLSLPASVIHSVPVAGNTSVTYYLTGATESGSVGSSVVNGSSLTAIFVPGGYLP